MFLFALLLPGWSWSLELFFCVLEVCEESQISRAGRKLQPGHSKPGREEPYKNSERKKIRILVLLCDQWEVQFSYKKICEIEEINHKNLNPSLTTGNRIVWV